MGDGHIVVWRKDAKCRFHYNLLNVLVEFKRVLR